MVEADEAGGERPAVGGNEDSPDFGKIKGDSSTLVFFLILPWVLGFSEALGGDGGEDDNRQILSLPENGRHEVIGKAPNNEPEDDILSALRESMDKGFSMALDDFIYHKRVASVMELCRIIKFDLMATPLESLIDIVKDAMTCLGTGELRTFINLVVLSDLSEKNQ